MVQNRGGSVSLKLIDFGLAQLATSSHKPALGGTWAYRAPETYRSPHMAAHPAIDVFAFGRLCHFVFVGTPPFAALGMTTDALKLRITGGEHLRPVWPSVLSETGVRLSRLEELCAQQDPANRPTMTMCQLMANMASASAGRDDTR